MILIIDDNCEEKLGKFKDFLISEGFEVTVATNLADANQFFKENATEIDGIILDFEFPNSNNDNGFSENNSKTPNGITFLNTNYFQLQLKQIPIVINTSANEDDRDSLLSKTKYYKHNSDCFIYKSPEKQPLTYLANSCSTPNDSIDIRKIMSAFHEHCKQRKIEKNTLPDNPWERSAGGSFYIDYTTDSSSGETIETFAYRKDREGD